MDLDEQPVRPRGHCGSCHGDDHVAMAGAVARIGDDRQMGESLHHRNRAQIEDVSGRRIEPADPALTQDDLRIAFGQNVFGGEKQLLDGGGHAALEEDRLAATAGAS